MKVVAYHVKPIEKFLLARASRKNHDITFISDSLGTQTALYAQGKQAVIVSVASDVSDPILEILAKLGIRYIATHSDCPGSGIPEKGTADQYGILWAHVTVPSSPGQAPSLEDLQQIAVQTILHLDNWQLLV